MALVASGDPGIVDIPGTTGIDAFAVATVNLGASANITASADTGSASLPASAQVAAASLPVIISDDRCLLCESST